MSNGFNENDFLTRGKDSPKINVPIQQAEKTVHITPLRRSSRRYVPHENTGFDFNYQNNQNSKPCNAQTNNADNKPSGMERPFRGNDYQYQNNQSSKPYNAQTNNAANKSIGAESPVYRSNAYQYQNNAMNQARQNYQNPAHSNGGMMNKPLESQHFTPNNNKPNDNKRNDDNRKKESQSKQKFLSKYSLSAKILLAVCFVAIIFSSAKIIEYMHNSIKQKQAIEEAKTLFAGNEDNSLKQQDSLKEEQTTSETTALPSDIKAAELTPEASLKPNKAFIQSTMVPNIIIGTRSMPLKYASNYFNRVNERFFKLLDINKDIVGWIKMGDFLDQSVVLKDNKYYLTHNYKKESNPAGAIFLDESCSINTPPENLIMHGHNMKNGSMFGKLLQWKWSRAKKI